MAGKPVGTIFVELDLDASRYTKGQQKLLKDAQTTTLNIEQNFKNLGIKSSAEMDLMRAKIKNSFDMIANSSRATANDIIRAEEAKNSKLKSLNDQQFGTQVGALDKLKKNWLAGSAAIVGAIALINRAIVYMEKGAEDMQVGSSFQIMADSAGVNADRMIDSMREATRETINASDMMQKAIKLMTLGYNPEQIERFSKVVITASQIAGTTAAQAYDELADAIANRMPKALVRMGAVTKEQMEVVNKAIDAGADSMVLYELAMANLELKQKMLQGTQDRAIITMQQLTARTSETTEAIGKGLIIALDYAYRGFEYLAAGVMGLVSAYARYRELVYQVMGDEKQAADNRFVADVAYETRMDLLKRAGQGILDNAEAEKRASKEEIAGAQARVDAQVKVLKAVGDSANASKKAEAEAKKSAEVNKTFWADYKREVEGAFEFEKFKLDEQFKAFDQYVHDKVALHAWYAAESRKIAQKEAFEQITIMEDAAAELEKAKAKPSRIEQWEIDQAKPNDWEEEFQKNARAHRDALAEEEKKSMESMVELTERTASAMQDNFSNLFFDAMTGKLKTLEDYANAIFDSIARMASDMAAQMATEAIFGNLSKSGGGGGGGGLLGSILGMFGGGTNSSPQGNPYGAGTGGWQMHKGGIVGSGSYPHREMPAWMIASAPRLHNGLASDEFPAVLQKGERVIPKGKSANTNNITINVAAPGGRMDRESLNSIQTGLYTALQRAGSRNS
jgi:hypothetical protein